MRYATFLTLGLVVTLAAPVRAQQTTRSNVSQAELFLKFLRAAAVAPPDTALVDSVLHQRGTALVIQQQNITRTVTAEQYRTILLHARDSAPPVFARAESERAQRGITGLVHDVWPAIHWGISNVDVLQQHLAELERVDLATAARARALSFLPPGAQVNARPFVVMGGRAGGASFDGGEIYIDLLTEMFRAAVRKQSSPTPEQFTTFFAHEMHHLGLGPFIARTRASLALNEQEAGAFDFLSLLVGEGSASYLTGPRDLDAMRRSPEYASYLADPAALLATCERVLNGALHENLTGDALDRAQAPLSGSGWHAAGAFMFSAIDKAGGFAAMLPVLTDPRQLLVAYNRAGGVPAVRDTLAREVAVIGRAR